MKYFVDTSEDKRLDAASREHLRGDFIDLSDGVTHYELRGPDDGEVAVLAGGLTIPLFYWDDVAPRLHERGMRTLAYSAYGRGYSDRVHTRYDEALFVRQLRELTETLELPARRHIVGTSMGALIAMASIAQGATIATTLTLIGPAGLSTASAMQQRLLHNDLIATVVAKRFGRRILMGHLGHNVSDPQRAADMTAMISDCYRYEGSMYAFFSTLQNFPCRAVPSYTGAQAISEYRPCWCGAPRISSHPSMALRRPVNCCGPSDATSSTTAATWPPMNVPRMSPNCWRRSPHPNPIGSNHDL